MNAMQSAQRRGALALAATLFAHTVLAGELLVDVRDSAGKPLADAVVYAEPTSGAAPRPVGTPKALIDQVNREFVPRVSIVQAGTSIAFPNSDNIRHSIYSFSPAKPFTTKLYSGREAAPVLFDKTGLVVLGCNIHDQMIAWVVVVDTPWFGKSDESGLASLAGLPAGEYRVSAWSPSPTFAPTVVRVRVAEGPTRQEIKLAQ